MLLPQIARFEPGSPIVVTAPNYHPDFVAAAKRLRGRFVDGKWRFDHRDEERVRMACIEIWGACEGDPCLTFATVRLRIRSHGARELYVAGRKVAERRARDEEVRLGPSCAITSGRFASSGGSVKHPAIGHAAGAEPVVIEVRDVPREIAGGFVAETDGAELVEDEGAPPPVLDPARASAEEAPAPDLDPAASPAAALDQVDAARKLDDALINVARSAQELVDSDDECEACERDGYVSVGREEFDDLKRQIAEWKKATQAFLSATAGAS